MTIYLVRHARAEPRKGYVGDDLDRPLDTRGREQAASIATALGDQPIDSMHSSRADRCEQTLAPLAARTGHEIQPEDALTEGALGEVAVDRCRELAAYEAVLCSHGDVIPAILSMLMRDGIPIVGGNHCKKGSIWMLETSGRDIVGGRYFSDGPAFLNRDALDGTA